MPQNFEFEKLVNSQVHEKMVEGTFTAKELDVIYITAPNGNEFRAEFKFEWEMIKAGDEDAKIKDKVIKFYQFFAEVTINLFRSFDITI